MQEAQLLPGEVLSSRKEEEWEVVQTGMENTFCAPRSSVPLRVRNDTHWSRDSSHASTGSLSSYPKAGWVVASQGGEMEGRGGREGETGRAEGNPSSSHCKRSATENSNASRKVNKAACTP